MDPRKVKRQARLHALPMGWEQLDYTTFLERRRGLISGVVRNGFDTLWGHEPKPQETSTADLIASGESETVEFKSTARVNLHTSQADPKIEHVIVKTVCGLLNQEGGTLLIGVADDQHVLGLTADFSTLGARGNRDGLELFIRQLIDSNLSAPTAQTVRIRFDSVQGKDVCLVAVAPSARPVFAKPAKGSGSEVSEFWVRIGNATKQLHGDDMVTYQTEHWG
jgi:predicted HTH transcriptional regulator